ncbi:hypothetical protein [Niemeyer virus]|uniref:Uncharacterized protein L881 n=7 Tax=Mimivirus TaxID=315393 RepID=YL881_MIMIV|nr:hypothetical protein MIMI_gp0947 [Acanthamoeba polyphaga mimivirus]Q5UQX7.1 RecName: Full=Uncharacterized protein L881; Flags: Precursor [Acanthamoeba polyphaga mimivirus]ALR84519.1 hypothetical protein [Niemeyer virus]AMZ03319.1 hypothetical protein [Mimivirus Bombay]AAV51138.1 unknown [Acanthamoeba polyphaga mimivirus]ADO18443.1 hypothetical protein [Acanthamoeba polyphaga mimivirus]
MIRTIIVFMLLTISFGQNIIDYHCDNCDENAECMVELKEDATFSHYKCACKSGYSGDGYICLANKCQFDYECPSSYFHGECNNGICACRENNGFVWNPSFDNLIDRDVCKCEYGSNLYWFGGRAICIPNGQCMEKYHCTSTYEFYKISCQEPGSYGNFGICVCNYGYQQNDNECYCPPHKKEVWDSSNPRYICLE